MIVGQAPGIHEEKIGKPFAWTAGKTLFKWLFNSTGLNEEEIRSRIYFAAMCRCFPGKNKSGGDRVPNRIELLNCSDYLKFEINLLRPELIIPVGRLAIENFIHERTMNETVGSLLKIEQSDYKIDIISLPHPSGASTWFRKLPGKELLELALDLISKHSAVLEVKKDCFSPEKQRL